MSYVKFTESINMDLINHILNGMVLLMHSVYKIDIYFVFTSTL